MKKYTIMKKITDRVLYFHDFMTDEEATLEEIKMFKREFYNNGILIDDIEETEDVPFRGNRGYDILLFDWGGASLGNSCLRHFCEDILEEAIDNPNRVYIMVSFFTEEAMIEAMDSFKKANGLLPSNVFLDIKSASIYLSKLN